MVKIHTGCLILALLAWLMPADVFATLHPQQGRFMQRDPLGYVDGMGMYEYVRSDPAVRRDPTGRSIYDAPQPVQRSECAGTCGADITDWFAEEAESQRRGWDAYAADFRNRHNGIGLGYYQYAWWSYNNHYYKSTAGTGGVVEPPSPTSGFSYNFSGGTACGTKGDPAKPACGESVTLCGQCMHKSVLGNLMFGYMARYAQQNLDDVTKYVEERKSGNQKDPFDPPVFRVGFDTYDVYGNYGTGGAFCQKLLGAAQKQGVSLQWLGNGRHNKSSRGPSDGWQVIDRSKCKPCEEKTKETRHGGSFPVRAFGKGPDVDHGI